MIKIDVDHDHAFPFTTRINIIASKFYEHKHNSFEKYQQVATVNDFPIIPKNTDSWSMRLTSRPVCSIHNELVIQFKLMFIRWMFWTCSASVKRWRCVQCTHYRCTVFCSHHLSTCIDAHKTTRHIEFNQCAIECPCLRIYIYMFLSPSLSFLISFCLFSAACAIGSIIYRPDAPLDLHVHFFGPINMDTNTNDVDASSMENDENTANDEIDEFLPFQWEMHIKLSRQLCTHMLTWCIKSLLFFQFSISESDLRHSDLIFDKKKFIYNIVVS